MSPGGPTLRRFAACLGQKRQPASRSDHPKRPIAALLTREFQASGRSPRQSDRHHPSRATLPLLSGRLLDQAVNRPTERLRFIRDTQRPECSSHQSTHRTTHTKTNPSLIAIHRHLSKATISCRRRQAIFSLLLSSSLPLQRGTASTPSRRHLSAACLEPWRTGQEI